MEQRERACDLCGGQISPEQHEAVRWSAPDGPETRSVICRLACLPAGAEVHEVLPKLSYGNGW